MLEKEGGLELILGERLSQFARNFYCENIHIAAHLKYKMLEDI